MSEKIINLMKFVSLMTFILLVTLIVFASTASAVTSITVVSPNGGENLVRGSGKTISWSSAGSPGAYVKLELLKNGALNRAIILSTPNDGSYTWTIPATQTTGTDYKVRVTSTTNSAYTDTSNNNFIIGAGTSLTVTSPNGGENLVRGSAKTISWSSAGSPGKYVKVELLKNGILNRVITSNTSNDGSHSWTIPATQTLGTDYKIRVTSTTNSAYTDTSNNNFIIGAGSSLTVTSPNGGENRARGSTNTISWSSAGSPGKYVKVDLLKNGVLNRVITSNTSNDGSHSWTIPATQTPGTDYKIRVTSTTNSAYTDTSNNYFIIGAGSSLTVTSPNGGENLAKGTSYTANWSSDSSHGTNVKVELLKNGVLNSVIASSTSNDGSLNWTIPATQTLGTDYKIKVTSTTNSTHSDTSNNYFSIGSSNNIIINSDKTITVNGKKTFPVFMDNICNLHFEDNTGVGPCDPSKNSEFLQSGGAMYTSELANINKLSQAGIFYRLYSKQVNMVTENLKDDPYFFGWLQPDESSDLPQLASLYSEVKSKDSNHPVILNHWRDMITFAPYTDILTWDMYTIQNTNWPREDSIYMYEQWSEQNFFKGTNLNSISKPVWAILQANGIKTSGLLVPTPQEARSNAYTAITMDVKGIGFWGYLSWGGSLTSTTAYPYGTPGLYNNPSLHAYYRKLASELVSLNDILVLPTEDYSWQYRKGTKVSFDKTLVKNVFWKNRINFNYMLKQSGNTRYLIIVNKDSRPITNVGITITGLNGAMTARTIGLETTGTGRAGRILSVNNGQFTDNFDGYAVHIYKVSS